MATATERLKAQLVERDLAAYVENCNNLFATWHEDLFFVGAHETIANAKTLIQNYSFYFKNDPRFFACFLEKICWLLAEVNFVLQNNFHPAWYNYWHQQRHTLNHFLIESLRHHKERTPEMQATLISALGEAADSTLALGNYYVAIYSDEFSKGQNFHQLWQEADYNLDLALQYLEYLQKLIPASANVILWRILKAKAALLQLYSINNSSPVKFATMHAFIAEHVNKLVVDRFVTIEEIQALKNFCLHTKSPQLAFVTKEYTPTPSPYSTVLNPLSQMVAHEKIVDNFFDTYQNLLADLKVGLARPYHTTELRIATKAQLTHLKNTARQFVTKTAKTIPQGGAVCELLEIRIAEIEDRLITISLLDANERRAERNYSAFIAAKGTSSQASADKLALTAHRERSASLPRSTAASTTDDDSDIKTATPRSEKTATSDNDRGSAGPGPAFLPSFVLDDQNDKIKKLFTQAILAIQKNTPTLAILFIKKILATLDKPKHVLCALAHAIYTDCLMLQITARSKENQKVTRHDILAEDKENPGRFLVLDTIQDMNEAIDQISLALAAILHMPEPYDAETNEILLGLNIVQEHLRNKISQLQDCFTAKLKQREEIKARQVEDGSWYKTKPTLSIGARFYAQAVAPNLDFLENMKSRLAEHTRQLDMHLQKPSIPARKSLSCA